MVYEKKFILFFKQKTAYEMRISDWSSDVCSSDLEAEAGDEVGHQVARHHEIGERGKQHRLHAARRLRVEGGVVGADRVLEERHPPNAAFQLGPEAALYPGPVALQGARRLCVGVAGDDVLPCHGQDMGPPRLLDNGLSPPPFRRRSDSGPPDRTSLR